MPKLPGINHLRAIRAIQKAGFQIDRQSGHVFMSHGQRRLVIPRNNSRDAYTMAAIVRDFGLTIDEFKALLETGTVYSMLHRIFWRQSFFSSRARLAR